MNSIAKTSVYQLQKTDIRVNAICPGLIETSMTKDMFDFARQRGKRSKIGQLNPMGRFGVAQGIVPACSTMCASSSSHFAEIAQMTLFLASGKETSLHRAIQI